MNGPDQNFRSSFAQRVGELAERLSPGFLDTSAEDDLDVLLVDLEQAVRNDVEVDDLVSGDETGTRNVEASIAEDLLGAVHAWASVASYATARIYAPASPMRRNLAGWSKKIGCTLQRIAGVLLTPLKLAAAALGASSWSISISFP